MNLKNAVSIFPLLTLAACAVSPGGESMAVQDEVQGVQVVDADTGEALSPIESIEVAGSKVEFFDHGTGDLQVVSWGKAGSEPAITKELANKRLSAVALYETLSGKPAPARMLEAQARADFERARASEGQRQTLAEPTLPPGFAEREATRSEDGVGEKQQDVVTYNCSKPFVNNDAWFNCTFCSGLKGFDYTWMFSTGYGRVYEEDLTMYFSTVYAWGGNSVILYSKTARWSTWVARAHVVIPNGFYATASHRDSSYDFDMSTEVLDATGDSYHWCSTGY